MEYYREVKGFPNTKISNEGTVISSGKMREFKDWKIRTPFKPNCVAISYNYNQVHKKVSELKEETFKPIIKDYKVNKTDSYLVDEINSYELAGFKPILYMSQETYNELENIDLKKRINSSILINNLMQFGEIIIKPISKKITIEGKGEEYIVNN